MSRRHERGASNTEAANSNFRFWILDFGLKALLIIQNRKSKIQNLLVTLVLDIHDRHWRQPRQERPRLVLVELGIPGLDAEEEAVAGRHGEARGVEDRVVGHGEAVQAEH